MFRPEDYVTHDVGLLLKEIGFNENCKYSYLENGLRCCPSEYEQNFNLSEKDVHAQPYTRLKSIFGRNTIYLSKYTETLAVTVGLCQKLTMEHSLQIMTLKGLMMVVAGMILKKL